MRRRLPPGDLEPSPANAQLVRLNLERNNVNGQVVEAAVGARDGTAHFQDGLDSNLGHLASDGGREVPVVSMETLLGRLPSGAQVDLVKMDIEGGEGPLLRENLGWLGRVRSLIAEFHPEVIDYPAAAALSFTLMAAILLLVFAYARALGTEKLTG